jgi:hypothetical protein
MAFSISVCPVLCMYMYVLLWNDHFISVLFARSRSFNLHLSRSLLLPLLVYFSVLANVSSVVFGPFFASPVVASLIEHTRTYISSTIRKRPTDGEKEEKRKRKNERIEDYVCCPDRRSPSPSLSLLYNSGGSRRRRSERDIFAQ